MSLIFNALQNVGPSHKAPGEARVVPAPQQQVHRGLGRIFKSPLIALAVAATIFLSGLFASHAVDFFSDRVNPLTPTVEAAPSSQPVMLSFQPGAGMQPLPGAAHVPSAGGVQEVTYQVHTPDALIEQPAVPYPQTRQTQFPPAASQPMNGPAESAGGKVPAPESAAPKTSLHEGTGVATISQPEIKPAAIKTATLGNRAAVSDWLSREKTPAPVSTTHDTVSATVNSQLPDQPEPIGFPENDRKRRTARATRHLKVSRLAHHILSAVQADDVALTTDLIQQLVRIKGSQNDFVLKLKAFSLIRQGRLDEARGVLSRVLAHNANDLEAGLNMAVIDIKSGRYDPARMRLTQLQELYPEESRIGRYLRQLPR